jgi:hypothetical protein
MALDSAYRTNSRAKNEEHDPSGLYLGCTNDASFCFIDGINNRCFQSLHVSGLPKDAKPSGEQHRPQQRLTLSPSVALCQVRSPRTTADEEEGFSSSIDVSAGFEFLESASSFDSSFSFSFFTVDDDNDDGWK